jgi:Nucleoside-diphosphate-sugar epimerases
MKILITGIHGFVGSNLVAALKENHTIYGLDIISPIKEGVSYTYGWDDLDIGMVPDVDAIIHLAGKAHDTKNQADAEVYFNVNTGLTERIYNYFLHSSARKFIFFSTAKAAADKVEGVLTEEVTPAPVGPYGESKIKAEEYILSHLNPEKQVYIMRPCMIHGPGNKGNLNLLYNMVKKGIPWPLGAYENRRTFTSIDNVSFVISGLLTKDVPSGIYNMGDDEALSTNELIEIICSSLGKKAHIWRLPKGLMNGMAKVGGRLHLPLDPERLRKLTENYVSSNAKIKAALGIEQMPVRAKDGLRKTLSSFSGKKV